MTQSAGQPTAGSRNMNYFVYVQTTDFLHSLVPREGRQGDSEPGETHVFKPLYWGGGLIIIFLDSSAACFSLSLPSAETPLTPAFLPSPVSNCKINNSNTCFWLKRQKHSKRLWIQFKPQIQHGHLPAVKQREKPAPKHCESIKSLCTQTLSLTSQP